MEKQITELMKWLLVETDEGTMCLPLGDVLNLDVSSVHEVQVQEGYGARLSMPGYLDCTDWSVHETEKEAWEYLQDTYED